MGCVCCLFFCDYNSCVVVCFGVDVLVFDCLCVCCVLCLFVCVSCSCPRVRLVGLCCVAFDVSIVFVCVSCLCVLLFVCCCL